MLHLWRRAIGQYRGIDVGQGLTAFRGKSPAFLGKSPVFLGDLNENPVFLGDLNENDDSIQKRKVTKSQFSVVCWVGLSFWLRVSCVVLVFFSMLENAKIGFKKAAPCCEVCCFCFWMGFHWFRKSMNGLIVLHTYVYYIYIHQMCIFIVPSKKRKLATIHQWMR